MHTLRSLLHSEASPIKARKVITQENTAPVAFDLRIITLVGIPFPNSRSMLQLLYGQNFLQISCRYEMLSVTTHLKKEENVWDCSFSDTTLRIRKCGDSNCLSCWTCVWFVTSFTKPETIAVLYVDMLKSMVLVDVVLPFNWFCYVVFYRNFLAMVHK